MNTLLTGNWYCNRALQAKAPPKPNRRAYSSRQACRACNILVIARAVAVGRLSRAGSALARGLYCRTRSQGLHHHCPPDSCREPSRAQRHHFELPARCSPPLLHARLDGRADAIRAGGVSRRIDHAVSALEVGTHARTCALLLTHHPNRLFACANQVGSFAGR